MIENFKEKHPNWDCAKCYFRSNSKKPYCTLGTNKKLHMLPVNLNTLPEWCPLQFAEDVDN